MAAGPKFVTPSRVTPSHPSQRFSLQEAARALPYVKRVVADIVRAHASAAELQAKVEQSSSAKEQSATQRDLDATLGKLQDYVDELDAVGVELKDYQTGLVDFVGRHDGRDVYLCWKLGEDRITHWHELDGVYASRKPVSQLREG